MQQEFTGKSLHSYVVCAVGPNPADENSWLVLAQKTQTPVNAEKLYDWAKSNKDIERGFQYKVVQTGTRANAISQAISEGLKYVPTQTVNPNTRSNNPSERFEDSFATIFKR